jgi:hypothetical protein
MVELVKILNTIMNGSGESGHTFLVLDLRRKAFSSSLLSMMLAMGFFFLFIKLRKLSSIHSFLNILIRKGFWISQMLFLCQLN